MALGLFVTFAETSAAETSVPEATGDPIRVGTIHTISGAFGQGIFADISEVWEEWTNANGGINGHPVELIVEDDATDPALGLSATRKLVDEDGVVAIIGSGAVSAPAIVEYAGAAGVPVVGGVTAQTAPGPLSFSSGTSGDYQTLALIDIGQQAGFTRWGRVACVESAACTEGTERFETLVNESGGELVGVEQVSSTSPDYSAACLSLIDSGAEAVSLALSPPIALQVVSTCQQQGSEAAFFVNAGTALPFWATDPSIADADVYITNEIWPIQLDDTEAQQEFLEAITALKPEMLESPEMGSYVQAAWAGMQLFKAAATAGDIGPESTSEDVVNAMYLLHDETLGGLIGPVTYTEGDETHPQTCFFANLLSAGEYSFPLGTDPICLS